MNNIKKLFLRLEKKGIDIELIDGELEVFYNDNELSPSLLIEIKENKELIIQYLKNKTEKDNLNFSIPKAEIHLDGYPLSSSQYQLWLASQFEEANKAYNISLVYTIEGAIDISLLENAFKSLIKKYESLRTIFRNDSKGNVKQFVLDSEIIDFKINYYDLRINKNLLQINDILLNDFNRYFDIAKAPLFEIKLYQIEDYKYIFSFIMHHIISDVWSVEIMINELLKFYKYSNSNYSIFEPLRIQYKDYSVWQQKKLNSEEVENSKAYWIKQFSGDVPFLDLFSPNERPTIKTYNGATTHKKMDHIFLKEFKEIIKSEGATLFIGLLSLTKVLLYKYTYQTDIVLGSAITERDHNDLYDQVGLFVSALPLRTRFEKEDNFISLLKKVKKVTLDAFEYKNYPFYELLSILSLKRDLSRNPLFDVMVDFQTTINDSKIFNKSLEGFNVMQYNEIEFKKSKFDLHFNFIETKEELQIALNYNTDIYNIDFISGFLNHFEQIAHHIIKKPQLPIFKLEFLNHKENQKLLFDFNNSEVFYPDNETIINLFEKQVKQKPDEVALKYKDLELTYSKLNEKSNQFANYLKNKYNILEEDLIGIKLKKSDKLIMAILGILKSGAAYVPIDISYPIERIDYINNDCQFKLIIDEDEIMMFDLERLLYSKTNLTIKPNPNNLAYVIYTSGTTGNPKGVMIEHKNLHNYIKWASNFYFKDLDEGSFGFFSSISFDLTITCIFIPLIRGKHIKIFDDEQDINAVFLDYMSKDNNLDAIKLTPSHLDLLKVLDIRDSLLKKIIVGGEPLSKKHINDLLSQNKQFEIYNEYGPTENTVGCTVKKLDNNSIISIGKPISNSQAYILDENLIPLPIGVKGKLFISGRGVGRGYLNQPVLTKEKFINNPFIKYAKMYDTGDLARWLPDGNIQLLGREDLQVKIRGYRIELSEIEYCISNYPKIDQIVVDVKENNEEKFIVAYIVSSSKIDKSLLRKYLQEKLPNYMIPDFYIELEKLPITSNGKADRKDLPFIFETNLVKEEYIEPKNEIQKKVHNIWKEILSLEKISVLDDFFNLGGNSLKILKLMQSIHKVFDVELSLKDFYLNKDIESLSNEIEIALKLREISNGSDGNKKIKI